jgi:hypothetical protein
MGQNSLTDPQEALRRVDVAFGSDVQAGIDAGASLVVGTVSPDGEPRANRAWAATVIDADAGRIRFVMSGDDPDLVEHLSSGRVSLTGADVVTYRSVQLKGRPVVVEAATADDVEVARVHSDALFDAIHRTDGNPIELLRRMLPLSMLAVEMIVDETFDQTPGPKAGSAVGASSGDRESA